MIVDQFDRRSGAHSSIGQKPLNLLFIARINERALSEPSFLLGGLGRQNMAEKSSFSFDLAALENSEPFGCSTTGLYFGHSSLQMPRG